MSEVDAREVLAADLRSIHKSFYGVTANDDVDFDLKWGEVHALLGENGAGKSTLCSILAGLYRPDAGQIVVNGAVREFGSPRDALQASVGMVYQHFHLVEGFTVAENIVLGRADRGIRVSRRHIEDQVAELAERYEMVVDPGARIWQLSVGEQQRVEILKLLYRGVRLLILDEPTAVLTPQEVRVLFRTVRAMVDEGKALVFVSHKLDEVLEISDRITVLRDGRRVGHLATSAADAPTIAKMMVGRELTMPQRERKARTGEPVLSVRGLRVSGDRGNEAVKEIDLEVRAGEIVGIAGVAGSGQRELVEALAGLRRPLSGHVLLEGVDATDTTPLSRIQHGMGFVPEDRLGMGLAPGLTVADNLALKTYRQQPISRGPLLSGRAMQRHAQDLIQKFDVRGTRPDLPVQLLSGGNLQRVLLAREVSQRPKLLLAASPTRGVDVGATEAIRRMLLEQRAGGSGILLISEDLDEIQALSDRILVIYDGRIVGEIEAEAFDVEKIGLMMGGWGSATG